MDDTLLKNDGKLHYLSSSLIGNECETISHLPISDSNFFIAWNTLSEKRSNKDRILAMHFKAMRLIPQEIPHSADSVSALHEKLNLNLQAVGRAI